MYFTNYARTCTSDCHSVSRVAKTKALISLAVTAKLICTFVFAYADCWFSHGAAQMILTYREIEVASFSLIGIIRKNVSLYPPNMG